MKIAILSPFYPFRGGMSQFSGRLYPELSQKNEVKAFSYKTLYPGWLFPGKTQFVQDGDAALPVPNERVLSTINPFTYSTTAKRINRFSPDVLIIPYWMSLLAPVYGIVCRLLHKKIKVVGLIHNAIPHEKRFFDAAFARFFFNRCDGFIVLSEPVKQDMLKLIPQAKIMLSPHPIYDQYKITMSPEEARKSLGIDPKKKTLLFFGLIREYKGLDILIRAMSYLDDSYQLIIAGESYEDFDKYDNLITASPLKDNIKALQQYIPDEMVGTLFSAADVLILPYRSATQSGVLAVATQLETPVISTNAGALGQSILSSGIGLVVDDISPDSIAGAINKYFTNPDLQKEYILNLKEEKKRLSWPAFADAVERFINEIL